MKRRLMLLLPGLLWVVSAIPATVTLRSSSILPSFSYIMEFSDGTTRKGKLSYMALRRSGDAQEIDIGSKCLKNITFSDPAGVVPKTTTSISRCGSQTNIDLGVYKLESGITPLPLKLIIKVTVK